MTGRRLVVATMVGSIVLCANASFQAARARQEAGQLHEVFPDASDFSLKAGDLPYFEAFTTDPQTGRQVLAGFVFYTTDLEPLERGYTGPIKILVGMAIGGTLTGSKMIENREPFGYFTVDTSGFHDQFTGKSVFDQFEVGQDIDAVSGATITVSSATRSIRKGVRRIARQYLLDYSFRPARTTP
ncbi:MAG: hypothetical protein CL477_15940 [Acidobacteria bacterium]|jgi:NosR/NirI family nitrous oxide reductase transcriptional regulator|nr:hypothetical protein [Acidobacteriota bacterium]MDP7480083.1 FMN-binding protein [Vicinamibacterales bacterium]HJN42841.1 FMN-binding protein [Vicinamibacterales bacterium]